MRLTLNDIKHLKDNNYKGSYIEADTILKKFPEGGEVDNTPQTDTAVNQENFINSIPSYESDNTGIAGAQQQQAANASMMNRTLDLENLDEYDFEDKYGTSKHRFMYDSNPEYKAMSNARGEEASKIYGRIDYPSTSYFSKSYTGNPNLAFATPNQQGNPEAIKKVEKFNMDAIGTVLPVPVIQNVGNIPSIFNAATKLKPLIRTEREINTINRVFSSDGLLGLGKKNPISLHTKSSSAYRVTGKSQIDDVLESNFVRPPEGKLAGGRTGEVHWSEGGNDLFYYDKRPVLEINKSKVIGDEKGAFTVDDLDAIWMFDDKVNNYVNILK